MGYLFAFAVGLIVGCVITYYLTVKKVRPSGTFVIDLSDPMKDICRFEMEESLESIYAKKRIVLNIKTYGEDSSK